jgi:ADP-heptose:LPS heptosyltransferase
VPGVTFYSLQKGDPAKQIANPPAGMKVIDLAERLADFTVTAAVIANLDLVIAVDTSIVHLAGALAKPVWTLLPSFPDWRWMQQREDSPWYPTMRLFRATQRNDWPGVMGRVAAELVAMSR